MIDNWVDVINDDPLMDPLRIPNIRPWPRAPYNPDKPPSSPRDLGGPGWDKETMYAIVGVGGKGQVGLGFGPRAQHARSKQLGT